MTSPLQLLPLPTCILCAVLATAILMRDTRQAGNWRAAAVVGLASVWALVELLRNLQTDPQRALALARAAPVAWCWMGPLGMDFALQLSGEPMRRMRRWLLPAYAVTLVLALLSCFTPLLYPRVFRTSWGWGYVFGPLFPIVYAFMVTCIGAGLAATWRAARRAHSSPGQAQVGWALLGVAVPVFAGSLTDGILPLVGIRVPPLGSTSFVALGVIVLWTSHRYGYSALAPGTFADQILDTLPDGVAMLRLDGRIGSANPALARMLGARERDLEGLLLSDRLSVPIHPTDDAMEHRCELTTLDGRHMPVAISATVLRDRRSTPIGLVLVVRDLAEVMALRDRLLLSGRLAAVGELAAGVAHEINNPLAFVRANLGLLRQHWAALSADLAKAGAPARADLVDEGEELIDESLEGVDRATSIVRDIRGLAHGGRGERRAADLNQLLESVLRIAAPQLKGKAQVVRAFGDVPPVWGAPQELQQVFLNLVLNAAQAIASSGTVRVATERTGKFIVVHVEDDGCGIDPDIRDRIFDPFFTTKQVGEGTGLGLGIAYGIVTSHGGDLSVDSTPGRGTRFSVHLPVAADTIEPS